MSSRLGYPLPSPAPEATVNPPEAAGQGAVDMADIGAPAEALPGALAGGDHEEAEGTWLGRVRPNKYSGTLPAEGLEAEEAQRIAAAAGLPYFTPARLAEIAAEVNGDPRMDTLRAELQQEADNEAENKARRDPPPRRSRCWQLAQELARDHALGHRDVWAVLVLALRHALVDHGEQLRYTLDRLQAYAAMGQEMSKYGAVLQEAQRALDAKLSKEKDKNQRAFVEVPFNDQREYGAESFFALGPDGELHYRQTAKQPVPAPPADALQAKEGSGYKPFWKLGFGARQQHFTTADGKTWLAHGDDEATRRADAVNQITAKNQEEANTANLLSATGLGLKVQNYTQQREQLQKLTDKWQTRFQLDNEAKNQTASAITSVLKNLHDMQSQITRNLQ